MAISENNKKVLNSGREEENTQKYLKFQDKGYPYLKTNKDNEPTLLPVPENSIVQRHIRDFNKTLGFLK
ncbi:hypothetical protein ACFL6W_02910 [Thermodesulfobacteriota bacterium]